MVAEWSMLDEFINLLLRRASAQEIMDFKASQQQNDRVEELLDKNREEGLTAEERVEIEAFLKASHYVTLAKIRAFGELQKV